MRALHKRRGKTPTRRRLALQQHRMVNETDIVELELKSKRFNLSVKKKEALKQETVQVRRCGRHMYTA